MFQMVGCKNDLECVVRVRNVLLEVVTLFQIECSGRFRNHLVNSIPDSERKSLPIESFASLVNNHQMSSHLVCQLY